jgi:hypothetical protein
MTAVACWRQSSSGIEAPDPEAKAFSDLRVRLVTAAERHGQENYNEE